ncbi:TadE/TadG family type IV pilus assembly protein [Aureimonas sp. AU4]|uniref:TadE/TadG family type IV pilus assembly protein n=1 Tax=Aureimonas sp. AU4 TaxID=1638163 RepID=UPI000782C90A|nr:TadE/TadG family type IV pilus assembly protein [Aureimonas sp. AU4]
MTASIPRREGLLRTFARHRSGAAAIEFALIALPFFFVLFASIETAIVSGANVVLRNAVDHAAREVLTGQMQTRDITPATFRSELCADVSFLLSCDRLKIDMRTYPTFGAIPTDVPFKLGDVDDTGFCFDPGAQDNITVVRAFYAWPWVTGFLQKLAEDTNGNATIFAMAAFMNEPFGTAASTRSTC